MSACPQCGGEVWTYCHKCEEYVEDMDRPAPRKGLPWSEGEVALLRERYGDTAYVELARELGRSEQAVRNKCWRLKLKKRDDYWTDAETGRLRQWYLEREGRPLDIDQLCEQLGRSRTAISGKARELGLSDPHRPHAGADGSALIEWREENGHPRGMLGKKHTDATKRRISEARTGHNDMGEKARQAASDRMTEWRARQPAENAYSRTKSGKREDLDGQFFRSRWEANYARFLNWMIDNGDVVKWEYEPDRFEFPIKRGTRSYTPDFKVWYKGQEGPEYHEVKGWMDAKSKTRLKRMAKYHPNVPLKLIRRKEYREIQQQLSRSIPNWE